MLRWGLLSRFRGGSLGTDFGLLVILLALNLNGCSCCNRVVCQLKCWRHKRCSEGLFLTVLPMSPLPVMTWPQWLPFQRSALTAWVECPPPRCPTICSSYFWCNCLWKSSTNAWGFCTASGCPLVCVTVCMFVCVICMLSPYIHTYLHTYNTLH